MTHVKTLHGLITMAGGAVTEERVAKVGETIVVALPENPTTGYRWRIEREPREATVVALYEPASLAAGGAGVRTFELTFALPGRYVLVFHLVRAWEDISRAIDQHTTQLSVS